MKYDYLVIAGLETVWRRYQPHHVPRTAGADEFLHVAVSQRRRRRTADHHLQVFVIGPGTMRRNSWKGSLDI